MQATGLTQILEILQAHGLMDRSDETFVSAQDLIELDEHLELIPMADEDNWRYRTPERQRVEPTTVPELIRQQRRRIKDLEETLDDVRNALG